MRRALYAGTFDPITLGHLDVVRQALTLFDEVEITLAHNTGKVTLLTEEERLEVARQSVSGWKGVTVGVFDGLLIEYARSRGAVGLVRGLRQVTDFDYELRMAVANRRLAPDLTTVLFLPSENNVLTSSSLVREIYQFGGDVSSFVPPPVSRLLARKRNAE